MRRGTAIFLLLNAAIVLYLLHACSTLIALLFEDGAADAIPTADIPAVGAGEAGRPYLIPKIIHQTYINSTIPSQWLQGQRRCVDLHPDYEYKLWTDETSRSFIAEHYPDFLSTFDAYSFPIQRADAIRYFVLSHYGGVYIDLDDGCARRLDPLLSYPAWLRRTVPTGISNDAMGSIPNHPFFAKVIASLHSYKRNWGMPYITVMYTTGPLFLSVIWKEWLREVRSEAERVRVLTPALYKGETNSFFEITKGSSWHGKDAKTIFWMGRHWLLLTVLGFVAAAVVGSGTWVLWNRCVMKSSRSRWRGKERYELINRIA